MSKKKHLVKDIVWQYLLKKQILPDHTIVPINHQQTDLRSANLEMLPGTAKSFKAVTNFKIPEEAKIEDYKFFPNCVTVVRTKTPWVMYYKTKTMAARKNISCSPTNINEHFLKKVKPALIEDNPNFEEDNKRFQKLATEFDQYVQKI